MTWDSNKYFAKAKRYWDRITKMPRDSELFMLQASFFCEFMIRGCLSYAHPSLNAAVSEESILYSAGISPRTPPRAVSLSLGVSRLERLIPAIPEEDLKNVLLLIEMRNSELHNDSDDISTASSDKFLPSIYTLTLHISAFSEHDLDTILGIEDAKQARSIVSAKTKNRSDRVKNLIRIQKDRFFSLPPEEQKKRRDEARSDFFSAVMKSGHHVQKTKCPSCACDGLLLGTPVGQSGPILREEGIFHEIRAQSELFECKCCDLKIKGLDELMSSGFPHEFLSLSDSDPLEYFGIDPMDYIDIDEVVREYGRDMYEYQDE